ncbi:hypothetical protein MC7420_755 [Coleofasciculus chthonoplastes PCC 7420]|uniref:Clp R domain-containing protein n=1 Tax=Coleofasciculus chthonoplastes PCC 7420 TaxID=118168 RepID=B4VTB7_9CYAN|nr:Clp protease N-terminal domain-containing protein [Coleofasciculus chthonoplastes]EDX74881.1 hypothetical protein MC7420_755 [Coleofasciculus chthonoplastes PCC 7420]
MVSSKLVASSSNNNQQLEVEHLAIALLEQEGLAARILYHG